MSGQTPMTTIKIIGIFVLIAAVVGYVGYLYYNANYAPKPNPYENFQNGEIVSGKGIVKMNILPKAQAATIQPTINPTPTIEPTVTIQPTPTQIIGAPSGNIIYIEKPTPTPTPQIGENPQYINAWNYVKVSGVNIAYPLKENIKVKGGSSYKLSTKITNLRTTSDRMIATLTVATLNENPDLNIIIPGFPMQIYNEYKTLDKYESIDLTKEIPIPNVKGHYKIYLTINLDNGANAEIMQEVTIT